MHCGVDWDATGKSNLVDSPMLCRFGFAFSSGLTVPTTASGRLGPLMLLAVESSTLGLERDCGVDPVQPTASVWSIASGIGPRNFVPEQLFVRRVLFGRVLPGRWRCMSGLLDDAGDWNETDRPAPNLEASTETLALGIGDGATLSLTFMS